MSSNIVGKSKAYRGSSIEELRALSLQEFANKVCSRERRSLIRSSKGIDAFVKKAEKKIAKGKIPKTQDREMIIIPKFVDWTIGVHNGKDFVPVKITLEMLGHRLGEFAHTRRIVKHGAAGVGATKGTSSLSVK